MLVRHGNSFALILDKPVLEILNVDPDRPVAISTTDEKVTRCPIEWRSEKNREANASATTSETQSRKTRKRMTKAISILSIGALAAISAGCSSTRQSVSATGERYPWKKKYRYNCLLGRREAEREQSRSERYKLMG